MIYVALITLCNETIWAGEGYEEGNATSASNNTLLEDYWNYDCVKTYADGTTRTDKFTHYFKSVISHNSIPGLKNTNVAGKNCADMVPQGICQMENYTIISAYCCEEEHKSVLYALKDGILVATIVLPYYKGMHVGGLAYDEPTYGLQMERPHTRIKPRTVDAIKNIQKYIISSHILYIMLFINVNLMTINPTR